LDNVEADREDQRKDLVFLDEQIRSNKNIRGIELALGALPTALLMNQLLKATQGYKTGIVHSPPPPPPPSPPSPPVIIGPPGQVNPPPITIIPPNPIIPGGITIPSPATVTGTQPITGPLLPEDIAAIQNIINEFLSGKKTRQPPPSPPGAVYYTFTRDYTNPVSGHFYAKGTRIGKIGFDALLVDAKAGSAMGLLGESELLASVTESSTPSPISNVTPEQGYKIESGPYTILKDALDHLNSINTAFEGKAKLYTPDMNKTIYYVEVPA
jgi:hypothetical protein